MTTAPTWDSYEQTLLTLARHFKPANYFEWGSGKSTSTMADEFYIDTVDSVEHDMRWTDKLAINNDKINLMHVGDVSKYALTWGRFHEYDLIFIDGIMREDCLKLVKGLAKETTPIILHDAERIYYQKPIDTYRFKVWSDNDHTVTLTDYEPLYQSILELFNTTEVLI